jgi:cell division protein FtsQ
MYTSRNRDSGLRRKRYFNKHSFISLLLILALLVGGFVFIHSSYFTVGKIEVKGNDHLRAEEIFQIADIDPAINIFKIDKDMVRKRLLQDLRIEEVTIARKFPTTIIITIKERRTIAFMATNYGFVQVDRHGYALAAVRSIKSMGMPMITGIKLMNTKVGDQIDPATYPILELLGELDEDALNALSEINISNSAAVVGYTIDAIPIKLGAIQHSAEKAKLLNNVLKDVRQQKLMIEYIDIASGTPVLKFKR